MTRESLLGFPDTDQDWGVASLKVEAGGIPVKVCRLDSLSQGAGVAKIDVGGREASVFSGAQNLLSHKLIRDFLFEEHQPYPTPSHKILLDHGYRIFRLTRPTGRPALACGCAEPASVLAVEFSRYSGPIARRRSIPRLGLVCIVERCASQPLIQAKF